MSASEAVVTRIEGDLAFIEVKDDVSSCGSCGDKGHCGKSQTGPRRYAVRNSVGAAPGDTVVVSVPEGAVLRAAALSYLMPLLFLFAGALFAAARYGDGLPAVAGAVLGLAAGLAMLRALSRRNACGAEPALAIRSKGPIIVAIHKEA